MRMITLSIIIPTFNAAQHIRRCLDSIVAQSWLGSLEVLCIDNLSTDQTSSILSEYHGKYPWIHFISQKDKGIYDAMNMGVDRAKGKWLYFLGSDDRLDNSDVLALVEPYLGNETLDVVYGNVLVKKGNTEHIYNGEFNIDDVQLRNMGHQAIFYRKKLFKKLGLYDLKYPYLSDWDFNLRWFNDASVKRLYIDLVLAQFASDGASQTKPDILFQKDLGMLLHKYGYTN